ncbi:hypothetical protein [Jannaschia ovalis]|uniref:Antibiotic biosynthesis monooxygenase n=1 Tax=Jannaschia ovalis TaxID=3038773 RepID=A0ABY8LDG3_9RHOB|nr:hypothetical protein [Jannaschia sp. GRR-S6-38]WGH78223.1 hypothetical protein P8627_14485 [Jannaschia sp. GRR-S6-38]
MIARITTFKFKKDKRAAAIKTMEKLKPQIMGLPGMAHFINAIDEEGHGYVVSLVKDRKTSEQSREKVSELWSQFAEYLEGKPEPRTYDVVADWQTAAAHA